LNLPEESATLLVPALQVAVLEGANFFVRPATIAFENVAPSRKCASSNGGLGHQMKSTLVQLVSLVLVSNGIVLEASLKGVPPHC
jgi:hypothetical protein